MVLRGQGTFLYNENGAVAHDGTTPLATKPVDIVMRRRKGHASVWVDGKLVADTDVDGSPPMIGVGCVGGKARIRCIAVRPL